MTTYRPCVGCGNLMRGHRQLARDHPGTVSPGGLGYCHVCRKEQRNAKPVPLVVEERHFDLALTITAYQGWIAERNQRLGVTL